MDNVFGKPTRFRTERVLDIFRERYLDDEQVRKALIKLVKAQPPVQGLDLLLYFHTAQSNLLLHDSVTEILNKLWLQGRTQVDAELMYSELAQWVREGKMLGKWSESTTRRIASGILSTLRDFGVLKGTVKKVIAPIYLPVEAFAYVAFCLKNRQPSGERLLDDPEWQLFFLSRNNVEHLFMEAHQQRLLEYHSAGSIIRIDFPAETLEEYAHVIARRAN